MTDIPASPSVLQNASLEMFQTTFRQAEHDAEARSYSIEVAAGSFVIMGYR